MSKHANRRDICEIMGGAGQSTQTAANIGEIMGGAGQSTQTAAIMGGDMGEIMGGG